MGQERAAGDLRIFSPLTAVVYYTQEKTTNLKMQTREAEELRNTAVVSDESVFPDTPWLRGTWLLVPDPDQAVSTSARHLYFTLFSLTCQDFVVFCGVFFFLNF